MEEKDGRVRGRTHHCTCIAAPCTLGPASVPVPIIPTTFDTTTLATGPPSAASVLPLREQGIVSLPDATHDLGATTEPTRL
jgi:hypothetical protein